jgi:hypothetical protein
MGSCALITPQMRVYMKYFAFVAALLLITGIAFSADIDGKWSGSIEGVDGTPIQITCNFKADGTTLTGSTPGADGKDIAIKDGKINGNNVTYSIIFPNIFPNFGQEMKVDFKGVLAGDTLKLNYEMMLKPQELTLKKAK